MDRVHEETASIGELSMEWTDFIAFISLPLIAVVAGMWRQIQNCKADLAAYKTEVAKDYASILYLKDMEDRIVSRIGKIEDKLDRYANGMGEKK